MPSKKFMIALFLLIVFPLVIIFANHDVFFTFVAIIIIADSLNFIRFTFSGRLHTPEKDKIPGKYGPSEKSDIDENTNSDFKKLDAGIHVARNLIVILFYVYCSLYIKLFALKLLTGLMILYFIHGINIAVASRGLTSFKKNVKLDIATKFTVRIISIFIIAVVAYNKFVKNVL